MSDKERYRWRHFRAGGMRQIELLKSEDVANLKNLDRKEWLALSMPVKGVRFDQRTLEFIDSDGDGRIRAAEVLAAIDYLEQKGIGLESVVDPSDEDNKALDMVLSRMAAIDAEPLSEADAKALADWEAKGAEFAAVAATEGVLAAVEPMIDGYFTPPEDMPLVTEQADITLPLTDHLNPKYAEQIFAFAEQCVKPLLGEKATLDRFDWKRVKAAYAPYREWKNSKPTPQSDAKSALVEEEKTLRLKLHLGELLRNFVNMAELYAEGAKAIFLNGTLRIDAKELDLCFHVDSESAHSALVAKSNCCVIYLKLSRAGEGDRSICAVVTAGQVNGLYVGRNGVFLDRDGRDWEAVVTKIVEAQVSLREAFWMPWRKLGEGIAAAVKKFLGDKQAKAQSNVSAGIAAPPKEPSQSGAAMASSVAAIGIGVGMIGAAAASIIGAIRGIQPWWMLFVALAAIVLIVSVPSVILTWFKLRRRDLGVILNASGWAINRPLRFSIARARAFTRFL